MLGKGILRVRQCVTRVRNTSFSVRTLFTDVESNGLCSPGNRNNDNLRLTGSIGTLKVPPKYPERLSCTWYITVPEGNVVKLSFTKFDLSWRGGTCGDYVQVFDGQYTFIDSLEKYCGYESPTLKGVVSSGRYMVVMFRADFRRYYFEGPNQKEGIEAHFRAVKKSSKFYQEWQVNLYRPGPVCSKSYALDRSLCGK